MLTLEDVFAIKITDYEAISAAGIDRAEVARQLLDTYLKQIFEDGFFHADPHPGNLFVTPLAGQTEDGKPAWRLTFVDFGMVGHVPDTLRTGLREVLIATGTQDAARLIRSFQTLHVLLPSADLKQLEQMSASMFDMFWGKSMEELRQLSPEEMFRFADRFRDLMFNMPFQLPQNLLMLGRTVAILSGMCTGLDNEFNLWNQLAPYATKLVSQEVGSNWRVWLDEAGNILKELVAIPSKMGRVLSQIRARRPDCAGADSQPPVDLSGKSRQPADGQPGFCRLLIGSVMLYNAGKDPLCQYPVWMCGDDLDLDYFFQPRLPAAIPSLSSKKPPRFKRGGFVSRLSFWVLPSVPARHQSCCARPAASLCGRCGGAP